MAKKAAKKASATPSPTEEPLPPPRKRRNPFEIALGRIGQAIENGSTSLDLADLGLSEVPEALGHCAQLRELDLSNNPLKSVPESVSRLLRLQQLLLTNTQLGALPPFIGQLKALRGLTCAYNSLSSLPPAIAECTQLSYLDLTDNDLQQLPEVIERLNVAFLALNGNPLKGSLERLRHLKKLHVLMLKNCGLKTLPEIFSDLHHLRALHLQGNKLTYLPRSLASCKLLESLVFEDNQLTSLPTYLRELPCLTHLFPHNNPALNLPPDVLGPSYSDGGSVRKANPADILNYYFHLRDGAPPRPLNEVKLLLVGRGKAGKSSMRDRLVHDTFDENKPETPGIDIQPWQLHCHGQDLRIHVWDFAGQEITHATHQFFLTERSVYVLVLEGRSDHQDRDAEYWLRLISTFGKNSPIIVALNQWNARSFDVDRNQLVERYPAIKAFIPTDCKTRHGIDALKQQICDILRDLKEVHEPFPASWWSVKEYFGAATHNYIPFTQFRELCEERDLKDPVQQDSLARILHALGIVLHYGEDARLKDTTVLNPQWVTNGVYHLLRLKDGQGGNGVLTLKEAADSMPGEPPEMVRYLIELMRRFELCYALDDGETRWLLPQVLTKYQPVLSPEWNTAPSTRLRYLYKVIPEGLLPRFIVRTHPLSEKTERWRNGVVLTVDGAQALVKAEHTENRITVTVQGSPEARLRLVQLIRGHLQDIHASLPGLTPREEMEVAGYRNIYKDVATLERDERRHLTTTVETVDGSIPIEQTPQLNTISAPLKRQPDAPMLRVFVSYSQRDTRHLDVFKQNLKVMQMNGLITLWHDGLIKTGSEWDQDIRRELEEADIIVFMVSTNFLASDYIRGVEMARAIQRKEAGEAEIVTLLLEPNCGWKKPHQLKPRGSDQTITCELKKYQAIYPANRRASRWPIASHAFNHVEDPLEDLRNQILAKRPAGDLRNLRVGL